MKISLLISTSNRPDALSRVLESVAAQTRFPDEVIVADDGSGEATRASEEFFTPDGIVKNAAETISQK